MSCYAVATVRGRVQLAEKLGEYLTDDIVRAVIKAVLQAEGREVREVGVYGTVAFRSGSLDIQFQNGIVSVQGNSWSDGAETVNSLAEKIKGELTRAAGLVLQERVSAVANKIGFVKSNQKIGGARVITVSTR